MKIAVLSDIHSNVFALEAVITDAKKRGYDVMVNLGDILYGPIAPLATYELLQTEPIITISGNQDRQIVEATSSEIKSNPTLAFILEDLGSKPVTWMSELPFDHQLSEQVYLCHGTPSDDLIYLLEGVDKGYPKLRADSDIKALLGEQSSEVILCGHTHIPRTVGLSNQQLIINPGSVGLQAYTDELPFVHSMENFSPHARYAMVEQHHFGWQVEHIQVPYKVDKAITCAKQRHREDWAYFLATGRKQA